MGIKERDNRPFQEQFDAGSQGGGQPEAEDERGDLYQEIGISSEQFKEAVQQLRGELQNKRSSAAEKGEGFNEAEYLRKGLVGSPLVHAESDEGVLFRQTIRAWDALAFDRYSDEVKKRAVLNLSFLNAGQQPHDFNPSKYDCMRTMAKLDVMTTAIGLSHTAVCRKIDRLAGRLLSRQIATMSKPAKRILSSDQLQGLTDGLL